MTYIIKFLDGSQKEFKTLTRADLSGANLIGANLTRADLTRADLTGANLTGANLSGANLNGANLTRADLTRADLSGADLTRANLTRADLTRANLIEADHLYNCNLCMIKTDNKIYQQSLIGSQGRDIIYFPVENIVFIGCFKGTLEEAINKIDYKYKLNHKINKEYKAVITHFQNLEKIRSEVTE